LRCEWKNPNLSSPVEIGGFDLTKHRSIWAIWATAMVKKLQERHSTSRSDTSRGLISAHPSPVSIEGWLIGMGIGEFGGSGMNGTGIGDGFWGR
jgi:hypothetical protein